MSEYNDIFEENLQKLIDYQIQHSIDKYGFFNSYHEFYSVLKEELEESNDEIIAMNHCITQIWKEIKTNTFDVYSSDKLRVYAYQAIKELIQVIAVLNKIEIKKRDE